MLTEGSKVGTPLVGMNFAVWAFKEREESNLPHGWAVGVRLGPTADGVRTQSLKTPPPALRRSPPRGILSLLAVLGQIGYIPSMNTDASLGYSVVAYRYS